MLQSDLGEALGVSAQAVSKWELGKAEPNIACILKMCELFGVTADQILGRSPDEIRRPSSTERTIETILTLMRGVLDMDDEDRERLLGIARLSFPGRF